MDVSIHNLSYTVNDKEVLHHLNGTFYKGRVTIFMGPSGAGKTTLMDLMAGRRNTGIMCGNISFNGHSITKSSQNCFHGYCQSTDVHIGELTVYQNLFYSCQLRSFLKLSNHEIEEKCYHVAKIVGLDSAFDTMVGNILIKGISGGQQKLLSIATELLGNPQVLFLDEPTTGLDSVTSLYVTKILHELAIKYQKTIISTIHQPSEEMIQLYHHLFLLSEGSVVYSGDIPHLSRYLTYIHLESNIPRSNMIEYVLELLGQSTERDYLIKSWKQQLYSEWSTPHHSITSPPSPIISLPSSSPSSSSSLSSPSPLPIYLKFWICLQRHFLYKLLSPHGLLFVLINNLLAGLFYGIIYYQNGISLQEANILLEPDNNTIVFNYYAYNLISLQFSTLLYVLLSQSLHISSSYHMKRYYDHEISSGYLSPYLVYSIMVCIDLPMVLIALYFYTLIVINLVDPFGSEPTYYGLLLITGIIGFALAQLMIIISSSPLNAFLYFAFISSLEIIFSGYFITKDELPSYLTWTVQCSNIYHAMGSMMYNEFHGLMGKQGDIVLYLYGYDTFHLIETYHTLGYYLVVIVVVILIMIAVIYFFTFVQVISCEEYEIMTENIRKKAAKMLAGAAFTMNERESSFQLSCHTGGTSARSSRVHFKNDEDMEHDENETRHTNIEITTLQDHSFSSSSQIHNPLQSPAVDVNGGTAAVASSSNVAGSTSASSTTVALLPATKPPPPHPPLRSSLISLRSSYSIAHNPRMISFKELLKPHYNRPSVTSSDSVQHLLPTATLPPELSVHYINSLPTDHLVKEKQVTLQFQSLSYTIHPLFGSPVPLLKNINGHVCPGELCAIIGPTGSGKTTLLNVLAGRTTVGKIEGQITVNSKPFLGIKHANKTRDSHSPRYGYVMQDDAHSPLLTVKETLQFAAMLRMRQTKSSEVENNVLEIMRLLGIEAIADIYIGSDEQRTISRGQLRRVTIGCEIVDSSSLIFLDEPTSGLDSYLASTIVNTLSLLASTGRTLLCTIHQPSTSIFQKFHKLMLLSKGHLVYSGPISTCGQYFEQLGYSPVGESNPAEYIVTLLSKLPLTGTHKSIESLSNEVIKQWIPLPTTTTIESSTNKNSLTHSSCFPSSFCSSFCSSIWITFQCFYILLLRDLVKESRRYHFWLMFYLRSLLLGFAIGVVWYNISCEGLAIVERLGLFLTLYLLTSLWLTEFIPTFHHDKIIYYREYESNAITPLSSWLLFGFIHIPLLYLAILILTLPIYFLTDLNTNVSFAYHYLLFSLTIYLGLLVNLFLNHVLVYCIPNHMIHILIFPGVSLAVQSLLSGYAVLPSTILIQIRWVIYLNPCFLVMNSLFVNEFKHNECANSFQNSYQYYEEGFSYTLTQRRVLLWLLTMIGGYRVMGYVAMRWVNSTRV